jgi:hypothetical protein
MKTWLFVHHHPTVSTRSTVHFACTRPRPLQRSRIVSLTSYALSGAILGWIHPELITNSKRSKIYYFVLLQRSSVTKEASECQRTSTTVGMQQKALPVSSQDPEYWWHEQVNLLTLMRLLDFGSGYDDLLEANIQKDAHETMQFGVLGMALSDKRLDAVFLKCFSNFLVSNYFSFSSHEDQPSPIPGVEISRPVSSPLIKCLWHQTAARLASRGG